MSKDLPLAPRMRMSGLDGHGDQCWYIRGIEPCKGDKTEGVSWRGSSSLPLYSNQAVGATFILSAATRIDPALQIHSRANLDTGSHVLVTSLRAIGGILLCNFPSKGSAFSSIEDVAINNQYLFLIYGDE